LAFASTTDQSYQRVTDWTTEQYAWAAQKNVPWLRRNVLAATDTVNGWTKINGGAGSANPTVTDNYGTYSFNGVSVPTSRIQFTVGGATSSYYSLLRTQYNVTQTARLSIYGRSLTGSNAVIALYWGSSGAAVQTITLTTVMARHEVTVIPTNAFGTTAYYTLALFGDTGLASTADIEIAIPQLALGACDSQRIATTWPAEYTALALAAGYPISLYSDRTGTTATYGPDDPVGVLLDQSENLSGAVGGRRNMSYATESIANSTYWTPTACSAAGSTVTAAAGNTSHYIVAATGSTATFAAGQSMVLSAKLKYINQQYVQLFFFAASHGSSAFANFDIQNGSVGSVGVAVTGSGISAADEAGYCTAYIIAPVTIAAAGGFACAFVPASNSARAAAQNAAGTEQFGITEMMYAITGATYQKVTDTWFNGSVPGYHATAPSVAGSPTLRLDGNGKFYLDRDTTDDNLPITWPTVLSDSQLGPELVTNGDLSSETGWTKGNGWTFSSGTASCTTAAALSSLSQSFYGLAAAGKSYRVSMQVTSVTANGVFARFLGDGANVAASSSFTSAGTYTFILVAPSAASTLTFEMRLNINSTVTVDNISVREVTDTNVIYTATGDYTTKDSGLILSGATDYKYPQRPSGDYGRIVMAAESKYDAKIIKYLDAKRGRSYQLGPELVTALNFTSTWLVVGGGSAVSANSFSSSGAGGLQHATLLTVGKTYLVVFGYSKSDAAAGISLNNNNGVKSNTLLDTTASSGSYSNTVSALTTYLYLRLSATATMSNVTLSVREILL
jgi:hypothetical protein